MICRTRHETMRHPTTSFRLLTIHPIWAHLAKRSRGGGETRLGASADGRLGAAFGAIAAILDPLGFQQAVRRGITGHYSFPPVR